MTSPRPISPLLGRRTLFTALLLLTASLVLRFLFWRAAPDFAWPYSAYYKGDAPVWLDYARSLIQGTTFDWNLPLRPPGMVALVQAFWDGSPESVVRLRAIWCGLGSVLPPLFFLAAVRPFGYRTAALAGVGMTASTGLMILSTSLNNDVPYLVLVALSLLLLDRLAARPGRIVLPLWAAIQGAACLLRAEHLLFFGLCVVFLLVSWKPFSRRTLLRAAGIAFFFVLPLVPWHLSAWRTTADFNTHRQDLGETIEETVRSFDAATSHLVWEEAAVREVDGFPAFARHLWRAMIGTTVAYRGGTRVEGADVDILRQAFGSLPEPLPERFFVTLYGPLNFHLANNDSARGGFNRNILEVPPPLAGGPESYPIYFARDFPPEDDLAPWYPPHLEALNHGYRLGAAWILHHTGRYLALAGHKLARFWAGASLGMGGYGLPLGTGGIRYSVDLVVPRTNPASTLWRLAVLGLFAAGLAACRRNPAVLPWALFFAAQTAVTVLFFGYTRIGAMTIPVVAVFVSAAMVRWVLGRVPSRLWPAAAGVLLAGFCILETVRFLNPPQVYVRQRKVVDRDPYPPGLYIDQYVNLRPGEK